MNKNIDISWIILSIVLLFCMFTMNTCSKPEPIGEPIPVEKPVVEKQHDRTIICGNEAVGMTTGDSLRTSNFYIYDAEQGYVQCLEWEFIED